MNITDRALIRSIIDALTNTGAKPPAIVLSTHAATVHLAEAARRLSPEPGALHQAIAAALSEGRDPGECLKVQRCLALAEVTGEQNVAAVTEIAYDNFLEVCRVHADAIVEAWREPFNAAAAVLVDARQRGITVPLEDTSAVMAKGGDIAAVWGQARQAVTTIDKIVGGWSALGEYTKLASRNPFAPALRLVDVGLDEWIEHNLERRNVGVWEATLLGLTLSLPLFSEYHARIHGIEQAAARRHADAEQERQDRQTGRRRVVVP